MKKDCLKFTVSPKKQFRVIINTDCKNEADDQFVVAHHLMTPKFDVRGIVACHFETKGKEFGVGKTMEASYDEVQLVLKLMDLTGEYPVLRGAVGPMADESTPVDSEGARFIIEEAMREDDRPLFVAFQGALTDLASALLLEPRIADRMTAIWIGGGAYPQGGVEFNLKQDIPAANVVMASRVPLWQVPSNAYKQVTVTLSELQARVAPCGDLGAYLFQQMVDLNDRKADRLDWPHGESWCLGDQPTVSLLLDDQNNTCNYDILPAPRVAPDCSYIPQPDGRPIRVYHTVDARMTLEDFYAKMHLFFPPKGNC